MDEAADGTLAGAIDSVEMLAEGAADKAAAAGADEGVPPAAPLARVSLAFAAADAIAPLDPAATIEGDAGSEELLAALYGEAELHAESRIPPLVGVCTRRVERALSEEEAAAAAAEAEEAAAAAAKGKKGKGEAEPEPELPSSVVEQFAVVEESGRQLAVTLRLPPEAAAARLEAAAQAAAAQSEAFVAAQAAFAEAALAASNAAEEAGAASYTVGEGDTLASYPVGEMPPAQPTPDPPPPPAVEWAVGGATSVAGLLMLRGMYVPGDVPSGPASLVIEETTASPALFSLPKFGSMAIPVNLVHKPTAEELEAAAAAPPPKKGK